MFKTEDGRRKGETHNRFALSESRGVDRPGEILDTRVYSSSCSHACRGSIDRSIAAEEGRKVAERNERILG